MNFTIANNVLVTINVGMKFRFVLGIIPQFDGVWMDVKNVDEKYVYFWDGAQESACDSILIAEVQ